MTLFWYFFKIISRVIIIKNSKSLIKSFYLSFILLTSLPYSVIFYISTILNSFYSIILLAFNYSILSLFTFDMSFLLFMGKNQISSSFVSLNNSQNALFHSLSHHFTSFHYDFLIYNLLISFLYNLKITHLCD